MHEHAKGWRDNTPLAEITFRDLREYLLRGGKKLWNETGSLKLLGESVASHSERLQRLEQQLDCRLGAAERQLAILPDRLDRPPRPTPAPRPSPNLERIIERIDRLETKLAELPEPRSPPPADTRTRASLAKALARVRDAHRQHAELELGLRAVGELVLGLYLETHPDDPDGVAAFVESLLAQFEGEEGTTEDTEDTENNPLHWGEGGLREQAG
ncbi:hypothetical protein Pan216_30030 [Planctomycetes bacterium Pan216]|uniref:Uncharacterized protein n=1 Tax=Kolteria novifilia TaxID=2527975 RepID=A0A518B5A7_9BACT|nr:hypothetical protein Pan216_30030 [Planctomycetes bacterium Pan216]